MSKIFIQKLKKEILKVESIVFKILIQFLNIIKKRRRNNVLITIIIRWIYYTYNNWLKMLNKFKNIIKFIKKVSQF